MKKASYYLAATVTSYAYLIQQGFIEISNICLGASQVT